MRILVHDYSGHPFQVELSRALARRGHDVLHVHCPSFTAGKGALETTAADPARLEIDAVDLGRSFERYDLRTRIKQELAYGSAFAARAARFGPDVILSSNDPLFAKQRAARWCKRAGVPWVFWLQDIYSIAMANFARSRVPVAGSAMGWGFQAIERRLLRQAAGVVAITEDFFPVLDAWRVPRERVTVIENWAPLAEMPLVPRANRWSGEHGLDGTRVLLYSGTLGLKHDPGLLLELARRSRDLDDVRVVVVSEGLGADWLRDNRDAGDTNLVVLPYQPWERMPEMLATADVLTAVLEKDAGVFSVPSKILTYLCAGRPLLGAMPAENLATRTVERAGAGVVVAPDDRDAFCTAALALLADADRRAAMGTAARAYAERVFDIDHTTDSFERVLERAVHRSHEGVPS